MKNQLKDLKAIYKGNKHLKLEAYKDVVIVDLETTCQSADLDPKRVYPKETIEIGAVRIKNGIVVDSFERFVKPLKMPFLTAFCKDLTPITQEQVDKGVHFTQALQDFSNFCGDSKIMSFGKFDKTTLLQDMETNNVDNVVFKNHLENHHVNLKKLMQTTYLEGNKLDTETMFKVVQLKFDGKLHRGIDDARNFSKLYTTHADFTH